MSPGETIALSGTTAAARPELGGSVVRDQLLPFQIKDANDRVILEGKVQDRVARSSQLGTLIFAPASAT